MEAITIHPKDREQFIVIEAFLNALKIPFEKVKEKSPYNPEFVKRILQGDEDRKEGKGRKFTIEELKIYGNNLSTKSRGRFTILDKNRESICSKKDCSTHFSHYTKTF